MREGDSSIFNHHLPLLFEEKQKNSKQQKKKGRFFALPSNLIKPNLNQSITFPSSLTSILL